MSSRESPSMIFGALGTVVTGLQEWIKIERMGGSETSPFRAAPRRTIFTSRRGPGRSLAWVTASPSQRAQDEELKYEPPPRIPIWPATAGRQASVRTVWPPFL